MAGSRDDKGVVVCALKSDVRTVNQDMLGSRVESSWQAVTLTPGGQKVTTPKILEKVDKECAAPAVLQLREGVPVICVRNISLRDGVVMACSVVLKKFGLGNG
jgi:hypothetical protein